MAAVVPFDPASYPGTRPAGPVVVVDGGVHPVRVVADEDPLVMRASVTAPVLEPGAARWVVAYGSNASPGRLVDKGLDARGAVLLPARLRGWVPAFEHRRTGYGSVPLTLVPEPGALTDTWVLGVHHADTTIVDASEGRVCGAALDELGGAAPQAPDDGRRAPPGTYRLGRIGPVVVHEDLVLHDAVAYLPGPRTAVQVDGSGGWRTWPTTDQTAARRHVESEGPWRVAPLVGGTVTDGWPREGPVRGR
jgi:hypothetical protein